MTKKSDRQAWHSESTSQATTEEAGDLAKADAVLLLWYFRNVVGVGEIDAYDYVSDGDFDEGIDGLFLEPSPGDGQPEILIIHQSKYAKDPQAQVGVTDVDRLAGTTAHFQSSDALRRLLNSKLEPRLRGLIEDFDLEAKLADDPNSIRCRLVMVTSGLLHKLAKRQIANLRDSHGGTISRRGPLMSLGRLPEAFALPTGWLARLISNAGLRTC